MVLLGRAPVNEPNASIEGLPEGETRGGFGGSDVNDSCGVIEYARIEFAGFEVYKDNELNGLTLGAAASTPSFAMCRCIVPWTTALRFSVAMWT